MIRHKQAEPAMPNESLVVKLHSGENSVGGIRSAELILPGGTQLMVIKNQLPSATHCERVCGSFVRLGKSMCAAYGERSDHGNAKR